MAVYRVYRVKKGDQEFYRIKKRRFFGLFWDTIRHIEDDTDGLFLTRTNKFANAEVAWNHINYLKRVAHQKQLRNLKEHELVVGQVKIK